MTVGILIGLGAVGHSFMGRLVVDAELAKFPIASDVYTMLFDGGGMALFGFIVVWTYFRRGSTGQRTLLFITALIGVLYFATGLGGFLYRHGDPFMLVFIIEGALLFTCSLILGNGTGLSDG